MLQLLSTFSLTLPFLLALLAAVRADHDPLPPLEANIAFHISVSPEHLPYLHRLYHRVYHPSNLYLIDYAPSIPRSKFLSPAHPNVHHRIADPSTPAGVSEVINLLDAMAYFLNREDYLRQTPSFHFFIPLTPSSYPLVLPQHLRRLLALHLSAPPNFLHLMHPSQQHLFSHEVDLHYIDSTLSFNHSIPPTLISHRLPHPDRRRRTLSLTRATPHFVLNRKLVSFAVDSIYSKRLLLTLGETANVRHRFFASLALAHRQHRPDLGPLVRTADLHCVNSNAPDQKVLQVLPDYQPQPLTIAFLRNVSLPCLFAAPLDIERNLHLRDAIDFELLVAPGTQGKPAAPGYESHVYTHLKALSQEEG